MNNNENNYVINQGAEQYSVTITKDEFMSIYKYLSKKRNKAIIICAIIFTAMALVFLPFEKIASLVSLFTGSLYIILMIIGALSAKKNWRKKSLLVDNRIYLYDIFEDKLSVSVIENNELVNRVSVHYENIKSFDENSKFYIFTDEIQAYFIRKEIISQDSILLDKFRCISNKNAKIRHSNSMFITFVVLTFGLFAFSHICKSDVSAYLGNPCYWLFFIVLPFSIGTIIISLIRKKHELKWLYGLIAGIVISIFCFLGGIQQFGYNKYYNSGYNVIAETENHLGIDLPKPDYISFYKDTVSEDNRIDIINDVMIEYYYYDFIDNSQNDKIWLNEVPDEFYNVIPFSDLYHDSDNVILYNVRTKEINTVPEGGTHQLVFISYIYDRIDIVEYTITL